MFTQKAPGWGALGVTVALASLLVASCRTSVSTPSDILLFNGRGTSSNDVAAIESILRGNSWSYSTASSARLEAMTESEWQAYRLLVVPGGNFETIGNGLTSGATAKVRHAIQNGLGYLGICAGAFFAGASPYNGLNLTSGVRFPFYALENKGIRKSAVTITTADGAALDVYWEDGPELSGWGNTIARYPDGTPAMVEGTFGSGWIVLAGVHAEAPESWRRDVALATSTGPSHAYVATLIDAALNRRSLSRD